MGARNKLNQAFFNGCLIIAGLIGLAAQSWIVFLVFLTGLVLLGVLVGDIRLNKRGRRR